MTELIDREIILAVHKACKTARKNEYIYQCYDDDLRGACAIASFGVWEKFILLGKDCKINFGKFKNRDHCWVSANKIIYDPTHCQFNSEWPIFIGQSKEYKLKFSDDKAIKYIWKWKEQSPAHFYFEKKKKNCKLNCKESLIDGEYVF